jgi:hypothetical protein
MSCPDPDPGPDPGPDLDPGHDLDPKSLPLVMGAPVIGMPSPTLAGGPPTEGHGYSIHYPSEY